MLCLLGLAFFGLQADSGGNLSRHLAGRVWHGFRDYPIVIVLVLIPACLLFLTSELARWRARSSPGLQPSAGVRLSRRSFMAATVGGGVALGYGYKVGRYELGLTTRRVGIKGLPPELDGLKVALMADWHCGQHNSQDYLMKAVRLCNSCQPDLILVPGDFISYRIANAPHAAELLAALRPRIKDGLLASWGNHDHWHGLSAKPELFHGTGVTILTGSSLFLSRQRNIEASGTGASGLWVAGVDDLWTGTPDLDVALRGIPEDQPRIVLSHNPDVAEHQPDHRVDLMVSGHTHGGQVRIPLLGAPIVPSSFGQKYAQGWVDGPGYPVFVTRGVGVGGIPIRIGVPPEVVLLELHRA